jgi:hypothetical protein
LLLFPLCALPGLLIAGRLFSRWLHPLKLLGFCVPLVYAATLLASLLPDDYTAASFLFSSSIELALVTAALAAALYLSTKLSPLKAIGGGLFAYVTGMLLLYGIASVRL